MKNDAKVLGSLRDTQYKRAGKKIAHFLELPVCIKTLLITVWLTEKAYRKFTLSTKTVVPLLPC